MPRTPFSLASYPCCPFAFRVPIARFRDGSSHFRTPDRETHAPCTFPHLRYHGTRKHRELPAQSFFVFCGEGIDTTLHAPGDGPRLERRQQVRQVAGSRTCRHGDPCRSRPGPRSEEHTSELQSQSNLVCRLLLEKKKQ